jgi:hypothetical protein
MGLVTSKTAEATYQHKGDYVDYSSLSKSGIVDKNTKQFNKVFLDEPSYYEKSPFAKGLNNNIETALRSLSDRYQPKGNYVTQAELNDFENRYGDEIKKFTDATYTPKTEFNLFEKDFSRALNDFRPKNLNVENGFNAPKANASLYGITLDSGGISSTNKGGYISVNNDLVVKGDNVVTFKKMSGGTYISDSPDYNVEEGMRRGQTKGNAIISSEKEGGIVIQSLDGTGNGANLGLRNNGQVLISGNEFCFNDRKRNVTTCLSGDNLATLKQNTSGQDAIRVPPSNYLRTRNYMDY